MMSLRREDPHLRHCRFAVGVRLRHYWGAREWRNLVWMAAMTEVATFDWDLVCARAVADAETAAREAARR